MGKNKPDLGNETILITAGPTQEPLDPVRYLSNRSSGRMGYALARAALDRAAKVILITGPVSLDAPKNAEVIRVRTAQEMRDAVFARIRSASAIIMCAAVTDFRPVSEAAQKIKRPRQAFFWNSSRPPTFWPNSAPHTEIAS